MSATEQKTPAEQFLDQFKAELAKAIADELRGTTQTTTDRLLTLGQVADRLGMTERAVRNLTYGDPPQLASLKVGSGGGGVRVESSVLEAFIEARRAASRAGSE